MKKYAKSIHSALLAIAQAEKYSQRAYADGRRSYEEDVTSTLLTAIELKLNDKVHHGMRWHAKVTTRAGKAAEEAHTGADFAGVLHYDLPDYQINQGFLAQAKRQEQGDKLPAAGWDALREQSKRMLKLTSESFIFVYAYQEIAVVSPLSVLACKAPTDLFLLNPISLREFFKRHFHCFIGDRQLDSASSAGLSNLNIPVLTLSASIYNGQ